MTHTLTPMQIFQFDLNQEDPHPEALSVESEISEETCNGGSFFISDSVYSGS